MSGGIRIAESTGAVGRESEALRGTGGYGPGARGVSAAPGVALAIEDLGVAQGDLAGLTGIDGEHARANQAMASQLDQSGIALAAHDLLVDGTRLRGIDRFASEFRVSLPQREAPERGPVGDGVVVVTFAQPRPPVLEPFLYRDVGDAAAHRHGHGAA